MEELPINIEFVSHVQNLVNQAIDLQPYSRPHLAYARKFLAELVDVVSLQIFEIFDELESSKQYQYFMTLPKCICNNPNILHRLLRSYRFETKINFRLLERIYNTDDLSRNWDMKEERVRKLLDLTYNFRFLDLWQQTISSTVKNLIFNKSRIQIKIRSLIDLKRVIESWQSLGITLYWKDIAHQIDHEFRTHEYPKSVRNRVHQVIGPLEKYVKTLYDLEYHSGKLVNTRKSQLRYDLNRRMQRDRTVVEGKHLRDYQMARYFKALHPVCEIGENCWGQLELNHIIPLTLGVALGGIDHPVNYQVLCRLHHDELESDLLLELRDKKFDQKLDYLWDRYPDIMKRANSIIKCL